MKVSKLFVEIYKKFNVTVQVNEMKSLDRKELLLLLILSLDSFNEDNIIVRKNHSPFKKELELILDLQNDKDVLDMDIRFLSDKTGEKYIDCSIIEDLSGNKLPSPLTDEEALIFRRDLNIDSIT